MAEAFKTKGMAVTTSQTAILTAGGSETIIIKKLTVANIDGSNSCTLTVEKTDNSASTTYKMAYLIDIPAKASFEMTDIVLEASDALKLTAGANSDLEAVVEYLAIT